MDNLKDIFFSINNKLASEEIQDEHIRVTPNQSMGATTLVKTTLSKMTLGKTTLDKTTLSIRTLGIRIKTATLRIKDTQHKNSMHHVCVNSQGNQNPPSL
jgi:hypothetical protein